MKYRNLGRSGLKVSELSFGSWVTFNKQVDTNLAEKMFGTCLDAGINFFDNAEGYERGQSEVVMGKALKALSNPRDSYCVSSFKTGGFLYELDAIFKRGVRNFSATMF